MQGTHHSEMWVHGTRHCETWVHGTHPYEMWVQGTDRCGYKGLTGVYARD